MTVVIEMRIMKQFVRISCVLENTWTLAGIPIVVGLPVDIIVLVSKRYTKVYEFLIGFIFQPFDLEKGLASKNVLPYNTTNVSRLILHPG
jgi:hypothetical protein